MTARHGIFVSGASAGVTAPAEARLALQGLLTGPGILTGCAVAGSSSGPNMQYTVAAGVLATSRNFAAGVAGSTADGLYLWANDGSVTVTSATPAPGSGTRYDLIYALHPNAFTSDGFGDATSNPTFAVQVGTAGSTPVKPYASLPAGAMVLAESHVGTSIANASLATIVTVVPNTASAGGVLPCTSSATYPASPYEGMAIYDQALNGELTYNGSSWDKVLTGDTGWVNLTGIGGSYTTPSTVATGKAQYRIKGGIILMQGQISLAAGGNFATSSTIVLVAAGNLPAPITPTLAGVHRTLASATPQEVCKGILGTDGSLTIVTNSTGAPYVNIGGFSGYTID